MFIFLHKPYLLKWSTKGEGVKNVQKSVHKVYVRPLTMRSPFQIKNDCVMLLLTYQIKISGICNTALFKRANYPISQTLPKRVESRV